MKNKVLTSALALSVALSSQAYADVTAEDVWANQQALFQAIGLPLSGNLENDGTVNGLQMNAVLPQGLGAFKVEMDNMTLTSNDDGTVSITYPSPMTMRLTGGIEGEFDVSATIVMTFEEYTLVASGAPSDVTYEDSGQELRLELTEFELDAGEAEEMEMTGFLLVSDWQNTSRVNEGNLITLTSEGRVSETIADFMVIVDGVTSVNRQESQQSVNVYEVALPVGGIDLMNLSQALRNGLSLSGVSTMEGSISESSTKLDGAVFSEDRTVVGPQKFEFDLSEAGLALAGEAAGFEMRSVQPLLVPAPMEFAIADTSINLQMPINASDTPTDISYSMSLDGITMGESVWNMFDPAGELPRDPAKFSLDLEAIGTNGLDLLDFQAWANLRSAPPIQVEEATINDLHISAVGAELSAIGAMIFDWTDFETVPGVARPQGEIKINLNGANALMDTLERMGFARAEDLMMPRMMLGMFATPVGDDQMETVIEVNEQGHILANGQRLQ